MLQQRGRYPVEEELLTEDDHLLNQLLHEMLIIRIRERIYDQKAINSEVKKMAEEWDGWKRSWEITLPTPHDVLAAIIAGALKLPPPIEKHHPSDVS